MNPIRRFGWPTAALALVIALLVAHHAGVVSARSQMLADSLSHAQHALHAATDSALAQTAQAAARDTQRLAALRHAQQVSQASQRVQDSLASLLRQEAPDTLQGVIRAMEAAEAQERAALSAQRDSALALFRDAAAQRDTLAKLLRAQQVQNQALNQALVQARKTPIWNTTVVRATEIVLAVKGASDLVRGR